MKTFVLQVLEDLAAAPSGVSWAEIWVNRKMEFHRKFSGGLITSISHGIDFFTNVLRALDGAVWDEPGEYGNNFRKIIAAELAKRDEIRT